MKVFVVLAALVAVSSAASVHGRIVDGEVAADGQFPYQVSLQRYGSHTCGGSILSNEWIITAAHCITLFPTPIGGLKVVAGINRLDETNQGQVIDAEKAVVNPEYNTGNAASTGDVALIKLAQPLVFNDKVQPIEMNTEDFGAADLIFSGWGLTETGMIPNDLMFYNVKSLSYDQCHNIVEFIDPKQVCTFTRRGQGVCNGDSGGPLVYKGKVAGLASFVMGGCAAGYPDAFTRVSSYVQWVQANMV